MSEGRPVWFFAVAVLAAAGLGGYAFYPVARSQLGAQRDREILCEAVNESRAALRNLLVSARAQTRNPTLRARRFYREQIARVGPLGCGNFGRDSLRRRQARDRRSAKGGDAIPRAQAQQPP